MNRQAFRQLPLVLCLVMLGPGAARAAAAVAVPAELEPWRAWVLQDMEFRQCPLRVGGASGSRASYLCAWPGRLALTLDSHGGSFNQHWQIDAESWVRLPGSTQYWPQDVKLDGAAGQVVAREGVPQLLLSRGEHSLSGSFRFGARPEQLPVDARTAIVDLTLDGKKVQPERPGGDVWLGGRRDVDQPQVLQVEVYRLVDDETPVSLTTDVKLQVSGPGREELLSQALPAGFVPLSLESELPARIEPDGRLRVQVRPGTWDIKIVARGPGVASRLSRPAVQGNWAKDEIWSFAASDRLRVAAAQGPDGIDPTRAGVPDEWRRFPAFRMLPDSVLSVVERARGLKNADENSLNLQRTVWLDFDGGGLTTVDHLTGTMRQGWRLSTVGPVDLQSAIGNGDNLLVTRDEDGKGTGVEIRSPELDLTAVSRVTQGSGSLPATGWNTRFQHVAGELVLPPGHRLLAVLGADRAPFAWIETWGLWAVFGVLIVAISAGWVARPAVGAIALVALLLAFHDDPSLVWLWGNLLAAVALARAAPEGRLRRFAAGYRLVSFAVLGLALLPFMFDQLRVAMHPQLPGHSRQGVFAGWVPERRAPQLIGELEKKDVGLPEARGIPMVATLAAPAAPQPAVALPRATNRFAATAMDRASKSPQEAPGRSDADLEEEVTVTGSRITKRGFVNPDGDQRYATGTLLQAGPGIPNWRYLSYEFSWSGPVEAAEKLRFIYIGPVLLGLWRVLSVVLLAVWFVALARLGTTGGTAGGSSGGSSEPSGHSAGPLSWLRGLGLRRAAPAGPSAIGMAAFFIACSLAGPHAQAVATPDGQILEQLRSRLTKPPSCMPTCADILSANVSVHEEKLDVSLVVSALSPVAVPMPVAGDRWQIDSVTLDGRSALAAARTEDGSASLSVPLPPGVHTVHLTGQLAAAASISLAFPLSPHRVTFDGAGWDVAGLNDEQRVLSGSLELTRRRTAGAQTQTLEASAEFPAFVRVTRAFSFGLDWNVVTTVERVAPAKAAMSVEIPLLDKESVLSQKLETHTINGRVVAAVAIERGQAQVQWTSTLPRSESLRLALPENQARTEVWTFDVSPQWSVDFAGVPAVMPPDPNAQPWVFEFHPRPGENLELHVSRPVSAGGTSLAVDSVTQHVEIGKRSSDNDLSIQYRSTLGGRHAIKLPATARVTRVLVDNTEVQVRPDHGELPIGLLPGSHTVTVTWTEPSSVGTVSRAPAVDLGGPASNISTRITLPESRWPLLAVGPGAGPAVLYWGQGAIFVVIAWLLGRWSHSPLRTSEWLLLGLGLSTLSWPVLVVVAVWLFAMKWRAAWTPGPSRWRFNLAQIALVLLTVYAVSALVFVGIRRSLLASPDMGLEGAGSYGTSLQWFLDRTVSQLPTPAVISAPMWLYRTLMFAWALWIVMALLRWLRSAWEAWRTGGIWRGKPPRVAVAKPLPTGA